MRALILPIVVFLLLAVVPLQAGVLQVAVPDDAYPPYIIHDEQGQAIHGLLIDPLRAALAEAGMQLELLELPILRSTHMFEAGQLEARMDSPDWLPDPDRFLWLEPGIWLEDVLIYRADLPFRPDSLATLDGSEIITHLGYIYPVLDPLFSSGSLVRLDKHTERDMIEALLQAPVESPRLLVMERRVWEWHIARTEVPSHIRLNISPLTVGCASLQFQLVKSAAMAQLQQRVQPLLSALMPAPQKGCQPG